MQNNITDQQRDQAYETATQQQRFLYADPSSGNRLWGMAEEYNLTGDSTYTKFVVLVGDVILNLRNRTELPAALSETLGISSAQAFKLTGDLIDFLDTPAPVEVNNEDGVISEKINEAGATPSEADDLASDIAEAEAAINAIPTPPTDSNPHIRTMAEDMAETQAAGEKTYSSTQEAILKEGKTKTVNNSPKWGSDS